MSRKRQEQRREQQRQQAQRAREAARLTAQNAPLNTSTTMRKLAEDMELFTKALTAYRDNRMMNPTPSPPSPPPEPPPTFSECVVGYRAWLVDPVGQLRAITMTSQVWLPGENTAHCKPHEWGFSAGGMLTDVLPHDAPGARCQCGLYAWNDLWAQKTTASHGSVNHEGRLYAFGAIAAWGDLRVYRTGFRAQHACVVALAHTDSHEPRVKTRLAEIADEYHVPLVHIQTLQAEAERHGTPLPSHVRPAPITHPDRAIWAPAWTTYGVRLTDEGRKEASDG